MHVEAISSTLARMAKRLNVSAGLLLFRRSRGELEVFLAHPGGLNPWGMHSGTSLRGSDTISASAQKTPSAVKAS